MIQHVKHSKIDKEKWDNCINLSPNGLIYATSFYLDSMCKWNALVLDDYDAVLPIPFRTKWGFTYVYQPAFIQQLGIFSPANISAETTTTFIKELMAYYKFAETTLNYYNPIELNTAFKSELRTNFVKSLSQKEIAFEHSDKYLAQRFRKAASNNLKYQATQDYAHLIHLYKEIYGKKIDFSDEDYHNFLNVCNQLNTSNDVFIRVCKIKDELLAGVIMLKFKNRIYNMVSCLTNNGKKLKANYFLYGSIIEEFSGQDYIFDFEGSDNPGIAYFYEKMADENQPYPFVKFNNLPAVIKLLKS